MTESWAYIDGRVLPAAQAVVPVYDRGFLYGDSVFETLRTYDGRIHALDLHLQRLEASAQRIGMTLRYTDEAIRTALDQVLARRSVSDSSLRIIVTRGDGEYGLDPELASNQRLVILARPLPQRDAAFWHRGVQAISVDEGVHRRGKIVAKTGNYLTNLLALGKARAVQADEAIRFDASGQLTEGSTSNVFVRRGDQLLTPDLEAGVLAGITRRIIIDAARSLGIAVIEGPIPKAWVRSADEVMISSTLRELVAVVGLDGEPVGDGKPGPMCLRLHAAYRQTCAGPEGVDHRSAAAERPAGGEP